VYHNYSLPTCQGRGPRLQACDYTIGNEGRAVPELGYHVWQTSRSHIDWYCLIVQHDQQCCEHPHQEMASYGPDRLTTEGQYFNWYRASRGSLSDSWSSCWNRRYQP